MMSSNTPPPLHPWVVADPNPSRPKLPPNYQVEQSFEGMILWSYARARLEQALIYWIATTRPDTKPHITPVWGVWLGNILYFDGHPKTRRGRNLAHNPAIAIHLESSNIGKDVVIVEGIASELHSPDRRLTAMIAQAYTSKYVGEHYAPTPSDWDSGGLYAVRPTTAFAWGGHLGKTATRWEFADR